MKTVIALLFMLAASTASAQCQNCRPAPAQQYPQTIYQPQTVQVPYTLQGVQQVPAQQPAWVLGQWRLNHLQNRVNRRRAWFTRPAYTVPIYGPAQRATPQPPVNNGAALPTSDSSYVLATGQIVD